MPDSNPIGSTLSSKQTRRKPMLTLNRAYLLLLLALVVLVVGSMIGSALGPVGSSRVQDAVFGSSIIGFAALIVAAFAVWAGAKGYSPWLGIVLAWIGPIGMLVLVFLEDKSTYEVETATREAAI